jgi:asparaginyl-tRNA synthetase
MYIEEISKAEGKAVILKGWVANRRSSGQIRFLLIRDGTGFIQVVFSAKDSEPQSFELCDRIPIESSVEVSGIPRRDPRAPGGYELLGRSLKPIQLAKDYPLTPKAHGIDFLLSHRHLWLRSRRSHALLRIRAEVIMACREFFDERGFLLVDAPILTPAACEGTTTLFGVDYFGQAAYLSQSGQLYMEPAAAAFGRVYCFGPTFRAERSKTRRHLIEFWMVEPEVAFMDLEGVMELAEALIIHIVARVLANRKEELKAVGRELSPLEGIAPPFPRIEYTEALRILEQSGRPIPWGEDFGGDEETVLSKAFDRPVFIHHYPAQCKGFYMKQDPKDPKLVLGVDMLAPEGYGELIGGGEREDDIARLEARIEVLGLPKEHFEWYLDLRRYGSFPHAGFGLGIERTVTWLCGLSHVREAIPYPRLLDRIYP